MLSQEDLHPDSHRIFPGAQGLGLSQLFRSGSSSMNSTISYSSGLRMTVSLLSMIRNVAGASSPGQH